MMRECPCSTKTREVLENPSPPPSRFPLVMGFAPLDPRDFPRASPSGNLSGLGKSWASGMDFPIPPSSWWSTDTVFASVYDTVLFIRACCHEVIFSKILAWVFFWCLFMFRIGLTNFKNRSLFFMRRN